ncbi:unnamed protein product [Bursaphelenchus okinawaensis]|uniref:Uncharacterized protein n=1 Tax=Bursaphelenchus okinawaensis TaxID=465554 RepID=A0A811K0V5_9BILA|nr:unnamed protein product [Bursaphelenchus okinawaensis]CAG9088386.1 unnamed protein product [Bursaphelenchus okinawaensis]
MRHGDEFTAPFTDDSNSTKSTTTPMSTYDDDAFDATTTSTAEPTTTTTTPDPADPEYILHFPNEQPVVISPKLCKHGILTRFEELVNLLSTGWKYHVANTDGIKDEWSRFEKATEHVCSYTGGML